MSSILPTGEYMIINRQTGLALDANIGAAMQLSNDHPRVFCYQPTPHATNHHWFIEQLPSTASYLLKTRFNRGMEMALDGNTNVPQTTPSHPAPFLYTPVPTAPNHRWRLIPCGEPHVFAIVNESNGLALDGNIGALGHHDQRHQSPFLWTPAHSAPNHQWIIQPVYNHPQVPPQQQHVTTTTTTTVITAQPPQIQLPLVTNLPDGKYLIVNKGNGLALDSNFGAARQISKDHSRVFLYKPNEKSKNHQWDVKNMGKGEYMLTSAYAGKKALDGNVNVPQHHPEYPTPFLYSANSHAKNHRWQLLAAPTGQPGDYLIVNASNGLALDGNIDAGATHLDEKHKSPFLWTPVHTAANHHWHLVPAKGGSGLGSLAGGALVGGLLLGGPVGLVIGAAVASASHSSAQKKQQKQIEQVQRQYVTPAIPTHTSAPQTTTTTVHHAVSPMPHQQPQQPPVSFTPPPIQPSTPYPQQPTMYPQVQVQPMDYNSFQGLIDALKREGFESNRKNIVSSAAQHNYFTCEQLGQIFKVSNFSSERLHAAQTLIPRIVDRQNSYAATSALTFSSEKEEISQLFLH